MPLLIAVQISQLELSMVMVYHCSRVHLYFLLICSLLHIFSHMCLRIVAIPCVIASAWLRASLFTDLIDTRKWAELLSPLHLRDFSPFVMLVTNDTVLFDVLSRASRYWCVECIHIYCFWIFWGMCNNTTSFVALTTAYECNCNCYAIGIMRDAECQIRKV